VEQCRRLGYGVYPARFGNIYTALQLWQLIERAYGRFEPHEPPWPQGGGWIDPFRPYIAPEPFPTVEALLKDRATHFASVRRLFETLEVFVFTLGLTEAWHSRHDGAVFPVCPGCRRGTYDPARYAFANHGVADVIAHLDAFLVRLREVNPQARVILTVSPVPLIATMAGRDVVQSTVYSKSVLRVAADEMARCYEFVDYFASYEIITSVGTTYFADDRRSVTEAGVAHVMGAFAKTFIIGPMVPRPAAAPGPVAEAAPTEPPEIICDEALAFSSGKGAYELLASFMREFYVGGHAMVFLPSELARYLRILNSVIPGRFTIFESLEPWLAALKAAAAGRSLILTIGGSHTAAVTSWPYAMARQLDELAPDQYLVANLATFGQKLLGSAEGITAAAAVLAERGLPIDRVISLTGYNDVLARLRAAYQCFVDRTSQTRFLSEEEEETVLLRHGWKGREIPLLANSSTVLQRARIGEDYGRAPPMLFCPLAEWQADLVERILFSLRIFRRSAAATGSEVLSVLQPVASGRYFPGHAERLRQVYRSQFQTAAPDFFMWRRQTKRLLHGGEYLMAVAPPPSRIDAIVDLEPAFNALELYWNECAWREPRGYLNLLAGLGAGEAAESEIFAADACHYSSNGASAIGSAIVNFLLNP
jgi:hypothetical protein